MFVLVPRWRQVYLIATDLKVSSLGWGQNQQYGSLKA